MVGWLVVGVWTAAAGDGSVRAALGGYGTWAYQPEARVIGPERADGMMGCGGLGLWIVPERTDADGRVRAANVRYAWRFMDVCDGIGAGNDTTWLAPMQGGVGAMAGGKVLYAVAQIEGGLGTFDARQGVSRVNTFGVTLKPRAAVGLQLGPVQLEVGPTWRGIVPLLTSAHEAPHVRPYAGSGSFDVEVLFGAAAPRRWY